MRRLVDRRELADDDVEDDDDVDEDDTEFNDVALPWLPRDSMSFSLFFATSELFPALPALSSSKRVSSASVCPLRGVLSSPKRSFGADALSGHKAPSFMSTQIYTGILPRFVPYPTRG